MHVFGPKAAKLVAALIEHGGRVDLAITSESLKALTLRKNLRRTKSKVARSRLPYRSSGREGTQVTCDVLGLN